MSGKVALYSDGVETMKNTSLSYNEKLTKWYSRSTSSMLQCLALSSKLPNSGKVLRADHNLPFI